MDFEEAKSSHLARRSVQVNRLGSHCRNLKSLMKLRDKIMWKKIFNELMQHRNISTGKLHIVYSYVQMFKECIKHNTLVHFCK